MSITNTIGSLQRLHDQALLADYATDNSTPFHLEQFRFELTRLLSGQTGSMMTPYQARQALRGLILESLHDSGVECPPAAADALMDRLINAPISDPLLQLRIPAVAAE